MNTGFIAPDCFSAWTMRPRTDVGAPVATDFRFIANAAERDADELPRHGSRNRLAERGLANAGWAHEAEDRALHVAFQLPDGEVFNDALFDFVEVVVVLVEHTARFDGIDAVRGGRCPRHIEQPVDVGPEHLILR
jgi:hypothetical protein